MVSTRPPTSKSSSPTNNPLVTVPKAPITISIIVTFMFHIIIIIIYSLEFLAPASADIFPLEFEWQPDPLKSPELFSFSVML